MKSEVQIAASLLYQTRDVYVYCAFGLIYGVSKLSTCNSNFDCLQKDHEQRLQRQQREGPHMVRHQEERVRSTDDWLGAAISASTPLSTPYTRGQRVRMIRIAFSVFSFVYNLQQLIKQTFPVLYLPQTKL